MLPCAVAPCNKTSDFKNWEALIDLFLKKHIESYFTPYDQAEFTPGGLSIVKKVAQDKAITDKFVKLRYKKDPSVEDFKLFKKLVGSFKPKKSQYRRSG